MLLQTSNMKRFLAAMAKIEAGMNDGRPNIGIIWGNYGRGKSTTMALYTARKANARHIRCLRNWSYGNLIDALLSELELPRDRTNGERLQRIVDHLLQEKTIIIFDEVNHIVGKGELMETIRDIHDLSDNNPMVLVGSDDFYYGAKRYGALWDRVRVIEKLPDIGAEDVMLFAKHLVSAEVTKEVAEEIGRVYGRSIRRIQVVLEAVEAFASANNIKEVDLKTYRRIKKPEDEDAKKAEKY